MPITSCRAHAHTTARLRLVASKALYDIAVGTRQDVNTSDIYGHTKRLFDNAQRWMARGVYKPVLDDATVSGRSKLSWWRNTLS